MHVPSKPGSKECLLIAFEHNGHDLEVIFFVNRKKSERSDQTKDLNKSACQQIWVLPLFQLKKKNIETGLVGFDTKKNPNLR